MKKNLFTSIIMVGVILVLSGCYNTKSISTHEENIDYNEQYENYTNIVNEYMNNFKNLFFNVATMEEDISIITGQMDIDSTEGNNTTKYVDSQGNVIRYNIEIYGETGKVIKNYYILNDNKLFVVELNETYSSPLPGMGKFDILSYDIKKYMIDGNNVYCLDDIAKNVIVTSQKEANVYMTLDELNKKFTETEN